MQFNKMVFLFTLCCFWYTTFLSNKFIFQVGPSGSGKTKLAHLAAQLAGRELQVLSVNSAMDTSEILGGFEQVTIL